MTGGSGDEDLSAAMDSLDTLLHLAHHDDTAGLFSALAGMSVDNLEATLVGAVGLLADRDALVRYMGKLGWSA